MERYRKIFFKITDSSTIEQIIANALISPPGELIVSYKAALNLLIGFILAKNEFGLAATLSVSAFLKMSSKKGLNKARETTAKSDDKILKLK